MSDDLQKSGASGLNSLGYHSVRQEGRYVSLLFGGVVERSHCVWVGHEIHADVAPGVVNLAGRQELGQWTCQVPRREYLLRSDRSDRILQTQRRQVTEVGDDSSSSDDCLGQLLEAIDWVGMDTVTHSATKYEARAC